MVKQVFSGEANGLEKQGTTLAMFVERFRARCSLIQKITYAYACVASEGRASL